MVSFFLPLSFVYTVNCIRILAFFNNKKIIQCSIPCISACTTFAWIWMATALCVELTVNDDIYKYVL